MPLPARPEVRKRFSVVVILARAKLILACAVLRGAAHALILAAPIG